MDHLGISAHGGNVEADGALIAIQIVIQTGILGDEQGSGDPLQVQRGGEFLLEGCFDIGDGPLGVVGIQGRGVVFGNVDFIHVCSPFHENAKIDFILFIFSVKSSVFLVVENDWISMPLCYKYDANPR